MWNLLAGSPGSLEGLPCSLCFGTTFLGSSLWKLCHSSTDVLCSTISTTKWLFHQFQIPISHLHVQVSFSLGLRHARYWLICHLNLKLVKSLTFRTQYLRRYILNNSVNDKNIPATAVFMIYVPPSVCFPPKYEKIYICFSTFLNMTGIALVHRGYFGGWISRHLKSGR